MIQTGRQVNSFAQTRYLIKLSGQTGLDRLSAHHRPPQDGGAKRTMTCWRKRRRKLRNRLAMNEKGLSSFGKILKFQCLCTLRMQTDIKIWKTKEK